jgi:hypothetical protein
MERNIGEAIQFQSGDGLGKRRQLVIAQRGKLHGIDARQGVLQGQPRSEITPGQRARREPDRFHQNTPKSRINTRNFGWPSKNSRVMPRRKRWLGAPPNAFHCTPHRCSSVSIAEGTRQCRRTARQVARVLRLVVRSDTNGRKCRV